MVTPVWRIGDFGRFKLENRKFPRFEVIASDRKKGEVTIWYSGRTQPTVIPRETFLEDCDNFWDVEVIDQTTIPDWVHEDNHVGFKSTARAVNVTLTEIRQPFSARRAAVFPDYSVQIEAVDVNHRNFSMRKRQGDYMSCMSLDTPRVLLLIPLKVILAHGHLHKEPPSRWDMINHRDILNPDEYEL